MKPNAPTPESEPEATPAKPEPETVEMTCTHPWFVSEKSIPNLPEAERKRGGKLEAGKTYALHVDDARHGDAHGWAKRAW